VAQNLRKYKIPLALYSKSGQYVLICKSAFAADASLINGHDKPYLIRKWPIVKAFFQSADLLSHIKFQEDLLRTRKWYKAKSHDFLSKEKKKNVT